MSNEELENMRKRYEAVTKQVEASNELYKAAIKQYESAQKSYKWLMTTVLILGGLLVPLMGFIIFLSVTRL